MGKAKKIIIGVVVTALVGTGIGGGLMYVRKGSQKEVLVASVSDLAGERYDSDTTLSGIVYANATQRISVEKDMIIQEIYVSKGDEVKPGDKLISFDMTLVEMELNIAKLKLQKQQQDLAAAKKRLTSLQNGGPILDSDSSSADNLIDSGKDSTEDKYMRKIVFENNDDKSRIVQLSTTVCQDCLNNMLDLIGNYLNSGGRIPW